jgi:hypothetical protein
MIFALAYPTFLLCLVLSVGAYVIHRLKPRR